MNNFFNVLSNPDKREDFSDINLSLASPERIRQWSYGEVRLPETINYRTFKPEPGGLFCAKIFGPVKDYECLCGKYKRMKFRGVVCEKCGVEVTVQKVRRERMGHIKLACPVAHILFFKSLPSRIGLMADLAMRDIERILYFEAYIVLDPRRETGIERGQMIPLEEYKTLCEEHPHGSFGVGIGAEGLREFMKEINLKEEAELLDEELARAASETRRKKVFKRLKLVRSFLAAGIRPEWMILEHLPVLPPDLRPLVQLDGGRFTTSDLNDLYRRVINRNNRLTRLIELDAPVVVVHNEKRMLQEAVDSLLDNGRRGKPAVGANKRPLKSLADAIKGKTGRFRQNLLGKRVDFSGRSVIVVGPTLKLHQCGLPKQMALSLFRPFVFNGLISGGFAANIKQARLKVDDSDPEVWEVLEEVIRQHPVLLNRAPTLHRLGVQAFEPVLIEGKAIQLHPLVCVAFNADFDGDQMAVHVPLSLEAQAEARVLMLSSNNVLAPANGEPVILPTQDIVLGLYYTTRERQGATGEGMRFAGIDEVQRALEAGAVSLQTSIEVLAPEIAAPHEGGKAKKLKTPMLKTTVGRALMLNFLPKQLPFAMVNKTLKKRDITKLVNESFLRCGLRETVILCDNLMRFGFEHATKAGISICMNDMLIPERKAEIIAKAEVEMRDSQKQFQVGLLTADERYNKSVDLWDKAGEAVSRAMMEGISQQPVLDPETCQPLRDKDGAPKTQESFNSIYMMVDSGARGSQTQLKQLAGMRGLMTRPDGRIMESAITANFREGLSVLQYFVSTHGARKGLTDTALKTANSGYLTRRLVDVTQDVVINETDCGSKRGITLRAVLMGGEVAVPLRDRILGRALAKAVKHPLAGNVLYAAGTHIAEAEAEAIVQQGVDEVTVRSPVTCDTRYGLCVKCYGRDLGRGGEINLGEAVGVVAAQSIGEPGTQLTMRTFHIGGAASREVISRSVEAQTDGVLRLANTRYVANARGEWVVVSRGGEMSVQDKNDHVRERYRLQYGEVLKIKDGGEVKVGQTISMRDPMVRPIIAEYAGAAKFENIGDDNTDKKTDEMTGLFSLTITEGKQAGGRKMKTPQIKFTDAKGGAVKVPGTDNPVNVVLRPGAVLSVRDGQKIHVGDVIAQTPQVNIKSRDITGGLPRVAELFEARDPQEPMLLANADGRVLLLGMERGKQVLAIVITDGEVHREENIESWRKIAAKDYVNEGDEVVAGETGKQAVFAQVAGRVEVNTQHLKIVVKLAEETHHLPPGRAPKDKKPRNVRKGEILAEADDDQAAVVAGMDGVYSQQTKQGAAVMKIMSGEIHDIKGRKVLVAKKDEVRVGDEIVAETSGQEAIFAKVAGRAEVNTQAVKIIAEGKEEKHRLPPGRTPKNGAQRNVRHGEVLAEDWEGEEAIKAGLDGVYSQHKTKQGETVMKIAPGQIESIQKRQVLVRKKETVNVGDKIIAEVPSRETIVARVSGCVEALDERRLKIIAKVREEKHVLPSGQAPAGEMLKPRNVKQGEVLAEAGGGQPKVVAGIDGILSQHKTKQGGAVMKIVPGQIEDVKKRRVLAQEKSLVKIDDEIIAESESRPSMVAKFQGIVRRHDAPNDGVTLEIVQSDIHHIAKGRTILAQDGSVVKRGEEIVDGEINPHEILAQRGVESLVEHIVDEVQEVYRLQGVSISDKHIEVIVRQMLRCVRIADTGDSHFIAGDQVVIQELQRVNDELIEKDKKPAKYRHVLLGITKASLATDSFISAASFQETTRVLTEASVAGRRDKLRGLKENVIVGRLIPAGTGFVHYRRRRQQLDDEAAKASELISQELTQDEKTASELIRQGLSDGEGDDAESGAKQLRQKILNKWNPEKLSGSDSVKKKRAAEITKKANAATTLKDMEAVAAEAGLAVG